MFISTFFKVGPVQVMLKMSLDSLVQRDSRYGKADFPS